MLDFAFPTSFRFAPQELFQPTTLMETSVAQTVFFEPVGDPVRVEKVIGFERQYLRAVAPFFVGGHRQTFSDCFASVESGKLLRPG